MFLVPNKAPKNPNKRATTPETFFMRDIEPGILIHNVIREFNIFFFRLSSMQKNEGFFSRDINKLQQSMKARLIELRNFQHLAV